jgi:DNA-binding transcriptional ArsR family regulator
MEEIDSVLAALADPVRREIVDMLKEGPKRAGDISEALKMSAPATSRHLRALRERGLVQEWHIVGGDARVRMYRLVPYPFKELQDWLDEAASAEEPPERKKRK